MEDVERKLEPGERRYALPSGATAALQPDGWWYIEGNLADRNPAPYLSPEDVLFIAQRIKRPDARGDVVCDMATAG